MDEAVASVATVMKDIERPERNILKHWIYLAIKAIGPTNVNIKETDPRLQVSGLVARKPEDMISAIEMALYDANGKEYKYRFKGQGKRVSLNRETYIESIPVSWDEFYIYLGSEGEGITEIALRYYAMPFDDNGLPMIDENHLIAIIAFCRMMAAMRENNNQSAIQLNTQEWKLQREYAKTRSKMPSMLEGKEIAKSWMSMINRVNFNDF
jgi:hypothetical protein